MTVLDAYAVVAFLADEPAGSQVESLLRSRDCITTALSVAEVTDQLIRVRGVDAENAALWIESLSLSAPVPLDASLAARAGRLRAHRYHGTHCSVSMADCVLAVTAQVRDEPLATADPDLLDVCHAEDIATIPLPGTDGTTWTPTARPA